jgi:putative DNA primase/helicase
MGIAEGFESAWAASFLHNNAPIWAALGADRFGVVALPSIVKRLTIYADYDPPGLSSALAFYEQHPELDVWIARPTIIGSDFARVWEIDPLNPNRVAVTA